MSALAQTTELRTHSPSVTTISANSRVDYILRFSKQAVIVVDDNADIAAQVSSRFVDSLSESHNAAFLTVSNKLNDIQIRCRLFEQLFGNQPFDPEQSLAISLLNMAKSSNEAISIVIEQAQFLSLQVLHELCQLAELAKKTNVTLNVLMSASNHIGSLLTSHKSLFKNKISILSAQTGQLVPLNAKQFRRFNSLFKLSTAAKWLLSFLFVISIALMSFLEMHNQNIFSFSSLLSSFEQEKNINDDRYYNKDKLVINGGNVKSVVEQASTRDIYLSLTLPFIYNSSRLKTVERVKAEPVDIFSAISSFTQKEEVTPNERKIEKSKLTLPKNTFAKTQIIEPSLSVVKSIDHNKSMIKKSEEERISADYYLRNETGYVIQISGFSQRSVFNEFISDYPALDYYGYNRMLNDEILLVITSKIYASRDEAEQAHTSLPIELQERGTWVKSVAAINTEIKAFKTPI